MLKAKAIYFLLLLLVFMSCQKKDEKRTDTLSLNFQEGDLPSLHPHALMIYLRGISLSKSLYEGLTRIDEKGQPQLAGAKSITVSEDGLNYEIHLRKNYWSDGTLVTANDYENAWKDALSPHSNCPRADLIYLIKNAEEAKKGIAEVDSVGVTSLNEHTLLVQLAYPSHYFLDLLAQPICAPLANTKEKEPSKFNGPFQVSSWTHGDQLRLVKNPYYWAKDKISLEEITIYMVQDVMTAFTMYEKNEIDWVGVPFVPLSNEIITHLTKQKMIRSYPVDRAFWLFLNTKHPSLSSKFIRQALNLSFDRQKIADHIFAGTRALNKPLPSALLASTSYVNSDENLLLANEKFEQGLQELQLTRETFPPLIITYSQQAGRKQLAEYLQQAWSKGLDIVVKIEPQEWNIFRVNLGNGNYQISGSFEAAFYNDPLELMQKFAQTGPNNFPQWTNSKFTEIVAQAQYEVDSRKRIELLTEAEQILIAEAPFLPIISDNFMFSHSPELKGYTFDCVGACDFSHATFE